MLAWPGGPTRQQILPGNTDSAEIRGLEGGVSYSVRVTALVGDREGAPVSIVVTTRRRGLGWGEPWIGGLDGLGAGFVLGIGKGTRIGGEPGGAGSEGGRGMKPGVVRGTNWGRGMFQDWSGIGAGPSRGGASLIALLSLKRRRLRQPWRPFV